MIKWYKYRVDRIDFRNKQKKFKWQQQRKQQSVTELQLSKNLKQESKLAATKMRLDFYLEEEKIENHKRNRKFFGFFWFWNEKETTILLHTWQHNNNNKKSLMLHV